MVTPGDLGPEVLALGSPTGLDPQIPRALCSLHLPSGFLAQQKSVFVRLFTVSPPGYSKFHEGAGCAFSTHFCFPRAWHRTWTRSSILFSPLTNCFAKGPKKNRTKETWRLKSHTLQVSFNNIYLTILYGPGTASVPRI